MVSHWLDTPVNGYLGSSYGQDIKALLQNPLSTGGADALIAKLRNDIPALAVFPQGSVNLWTQTLPPDRLQIMIEIGGTSIPVAV